MQLRDFRNIGQFLTQDAAVPVANAFVSSWLDYCNSLFRSLSKFNLHRLQSIQNSVARILINSSKYTLITLVLRKLHWLPVQFCSEFKLATLVCKYIHTGFPKYFAPYLSTYHTTYNTRRSQSVANFLNVPKFQPTIHKSTKQFGFPLFGIHFLKTFVHHPLLPLLERSSKPISTHILLSSFSVMASPWCWPISVPGLWIYILLLSCCALESTTQWRLSAIKVEFELEFNSNFTFLFKTKCSTPKQICMYSLSIYCSSISKWFLYFNQGLIFCYFLLDIWL